MRWGRAPVICALGAALALAIPASASAAITGSHVTRPRSPRYLLNNEDAGGTKITVKGTTTGGNPATDKVDLLCFYGTTYATLASGVSLHSDGSFSAPGADLTSIEYTLCRLRAVPAGTVPSNLSPFRGPLLGTDHRGTSKLSTGPNAGTPYDFYIWAQQRAAAFDYDSLSSCGIDDGYLNGSNLDVATTTFYCNDWLDTHNDFTNGAGSTRSELRIDGANAYGAWGAYSINQSASSGFPAVKYSLKVDPITGQTTIHDSEPLVKCPHATFPPTSTSCPRFLSTGVRDHRTIVQDHDGHLSTITDVFKSTNRKRHRLNLLWQNDQHFYGSGASFNANTVAYRFPGHPGYHTHAYQDKVNLSGNAPASIFVKQPNRPDGDKLSGRGAITYDRRASSATFNDVSFSQSDFYLHQTARIPRRGSAKFRFAYAQAFHQKAVNSLAKDSRRRFRR